MQNAKSALKNKLTRANKKASACVTLCAKAIAQLNAQQTTAQQHARANISMYTR